MVQRSSLSGIWSREAAKTSAALHKNLSCHYYADHNQVHLINIGFCMILFCIKTSFVTSQVAHQLLNFSHTSFFINFPIFPLPTAFSAPPLPLGTRTPSKTPMAWTLPTECGARTPAMVARAICPAGMSWRSDGWWWVRGLGWGGCLNKSLVSY